jgi:hypothetical protein
MADAAELPLSTRIILRDRAGTDYQAVLLAAIDDLVADGAWRHDRVRRRVVSRAHVLTPLRALEVASEPMRSVDRLLRRAAEGSASTEVRELARWIARNASTAPAAAVQRALEWLIEQGLLERITTTIVITAGVPEGSTGARQMVEMRPTESGKSALIGMPWRERPAPGQRAARRQKTDYGSANPLAVLSGFAIPVSSSIGAAWSTGFAAGTHAGFHVRAHEDTGYGGGHFDSGHHVHHG